MKFLLIYDTIARRLALTVLLAVSASVCLYIFFISTAGVWARPDLSETGLEGQAATLVRIYSVIPRDLRAQIAAAATNDVFRMEWRPEIPASPREGASSSVQAAMRRLLNDPDRKIVLYQTSIFARTVPHDRIFGTDAYGMAISLSDGSWLIFKVPKRRWGMGPWMRYTLIGCFVLVSTGAVSWLGARNLVRPFEAFTIAARRFGTDPNAPPMIERGPRELQAATASFNAMQTQIRRFITDRTNMLAAISHDLRTPLTRVRLRGEFIDDLDQRHRLFRDVDEMQTMIDSALAFFRDETLAEQSTTFALTELLQVIVDDLVDQGRNAKLHEAEPVVYSGRPVALKRAFGNIIENACAYGDEAVVSIEANGHGTMVSVRDRGPGIPEDHIGKVFSPFYRVELSRNRKTGGVGLGLTSARAIVHAHGGEIKLLNHEQGGLQVLIVLP
ncbi:two-component sensor histidine kinase [Gluconacetobacter aggeris]|uniref:histidine kinase n=1 Tax=Gluconacetobacter aggeris TaxID=1286186 RepID=A0A7W4NWN9_9PROT|nr:ATP-binding protein [Gluconacetobacter aggeris]MBB2169046.1 two-component sensor histidine kinase [Gluconacetobacter aggeris]